MKKRFFVFSVVLFCCFRIWADDNLSIKSIVNPEYYEELMTNKSVQLIHTDREATLVLIPEGEYKNSLLNGVIVKKNNKYPFLTENLFVFNKNEILKNNNSSKKDITIEDISKVVRSISTMKGIKYYSINQKKEFVLYKDTYMIESFENQVKIEDQTSGSADGKIYYCYQNDHSFGECIYKLSYFQNEKTIYTEFNNLGTMGISLFKAVDPYDMKINILVENCGDDILLYLQTDTRFEKIPGIAKFAKNSLIARVESIKTWFLSQF